MEKLVWNVYRCRNGKIKVYNIFQHSMFSDEVKQLLLQYKTKDEFAEELKKATIEPTFAKEPTETIIDAYSQISNNWNIFVDYVWKAVPR